MAVLALLETRERPTAPLLHLHRAAVVPATLDDTFAFFADAANLERLTPPWLHFSIRTPLPLEMREGATIDYRVWLRGLPMPWRSRIDVWQPDACFVDRQIVGPYRWWRHEHRFEAVAGGTRVIDEVEYLPRAQTFSRRFVERDLERIFSYRHQALARLFT
jgi:ligand-binding SRPBCC domain-containing protein